MRVNSNQEDCYDYVRRYYGVPAYIGVRVGVGDRSGVLVNHRPGNQYVYIRFDGEKRIAGPFHPTDGIDYRIASEGGEQAAKGDDR